MPRDIRDFNYYGGYNRYVPEEWEPYIPVQPSRNAPVVHIEPEIEPTPFQEAITIAATETPQVTETLPQTTGLVLHVDGDYLAYFASGNDETDAGQARNNALNIIEEFRARAGCESVIVHNTADGSNKGERFLIAEVKPYQGHRSSNSKPKNYAYLRDFLLNYTGTAFTSTVWADREADDAIAAAAYQAISGTPGYAVIATRDKDMRMLPGHHIDWVSREITVVAPGDYDVVGAGGKQFGLKFFWQQMLEGDTADNIPGLEYYKTERGTLARLGPKTAEKLLANATTSDEAAVIVQNLYEGAYQDLWEDRFVEQAALLWMRLDTSPDIADFFFHEGHSQINATFPGTMTLAIVRLQERVANARAALDELGD